MKHPLHTLLLSVGSQDSNCYGQGLGSDLNTYKNGAAINQMVQNHQLKAPIYLEHCFVAFGIFETCKNTQQIQDILWFPNVN